MRDSWDIARALRLEPTGRVPFWEVWFLMADLARRLVGPSVDTPEGTLALARKLGWDVVRVFSPGLNVKSETSAMASDGTSHYVQGWLTSLDQLDVPLPDPRPSLARLKRMKECCEPEGIAVCLYLPWAFHSVNTMMGLQHLSYALYDDPAFIQMAFDWVEERVRWLIDEVVLPGQPDLVLFDGDCAYKNGLMVNPAMFRDLVFERTRETVARLRAAGIPYVFHSDGKADDLLPILIELGFSAFHGVEAAANDLADIKRRFGDQICLIGNMDVVSMTHAGVDEVRWATERMLEIGSVGGGYVAACNTSPLDYIPHQNYMAFVDVIRSYRVKE